MTDTLHVYDAHNQACGAICAVVFSYDFNLSIIYSRHQAFLSSTLSNSWWWREAVAKAPPGLTFHLNAKWLGTRGEHYLCVCGGGMG